MIYAWPIISSILLILAFPNFNLNYIAFIGFVPLFLAIENKSPLKAFFIFYLCGFIFYLGALYWLYHVTVIGLIVLCLYLALYFGVFGVFISLLQKIHRPFRLRQGFGGQASLVPRPLSLFPFLCPAFWVILEYLQSHLFTGFGWALLDYSQYKNLPLIQIADFSGVYGVSFVVMMVNATAWILIKAVAETTPRFRSGQGNHPSVSLGARKPEYREKNPSSVVNRPSSIVFHLSFVLLVLTLVYTYGYFRLSEKVKQSDTVRISVIQGNIPQELKWNPDASEMILNKYIVLTKMSSFDNPDLIIWPETSFPGFFESDMELTNKVIALAKEIKTPLLLGANTERDSEYFNSAILISREGKTVDKYDKIHLVPFGEYVPFSNKFPTLGRLVLGELGEFTPGTEYKIFKMSDAGCRMSDKFGVLICYEDIFPELAKRFVKNGARFLVVITNDAWYGKSPAAYQHAACSVFRAIENRTPVVRCANTGYSCFIDSKGKIYDNVEENGKHLFITGYKTAEIQLGK